MNLQLSDKIMLLQPINVVYHKNASITIVLGAMVMLLLFSSCSGKKKELGDAITERDSMAVMDTRGVTTLVSDSGVTRYRINTEEWLVFDRKILLTGLLKRGSIWRSSTLSSKWRRVSRLIQPTSLIRRSYGN